MKLYIMKSNVLETLKNNLTLPKIYSRYFIENTPSWIQEICNEEPFVEFREIPDFKLSPLPKNFTFTGEIDRQNCKIIYLKLKFLSESEASDERFWAGLSHSVFYDYMRRRWKYDKGFSKNPAVEIKRRFFFESSGRQRFFHNTLAKCWWIGHNLYDEKNHNFDKLDLFSKDFSTKMEEIFHHYNFSSNPNIVNGIVKFYKYFIDKGIELKAKIRYGNKNRADDNLTLRTALQTLNAVGGTRILDYLSEDEVADIMIESINNILQGKRSNIIINNS